MPEHNPAPQPERGIYGFVLYLTAIFCLVIYLTWAFLPSSLLEILGFTYLPQKYWAIALPIYSCVTLICFEIFMFGYNLTNEDALESMERVDNDFGIHGLNHNAQIENSKADFLKDEKEVGQKHGV
uniref:PIG-P domain-containing protein n=1 Tax=Romanomermis culicivorax TaxID=13658 RepID=A0A915I356_ROMCU